MVRAGVSRWWYDGDSIGEVCVWCAARSWVGVGDQR